MISATFMLYSLRFITAHLSRSILHIQLYLKRINDFPAAASKSVSKEKKIIVLYMPHEWFLK